MFHNHAWERLLRVDEKNNIQKGRLCKSLQGYGDFSTCAKRLNSFQILIFTLTVFWKTQISEFWNFKQSLMFRNRELFDRKKQYAYQNFVNLIVRTKILLLFIEKPIIRNCTLEFLKIDFLKISELLRDEKLFFELKIVRFPSSTNLDFPV